MSPSIDQHTYGRVRQAVLLGLFTGTGVGVGHLLSGLPGIELMSTVAALAGLALGPVGGATVGVAAQFLYSVSSPFGLPVPLLLAAQLLGMAIAGMLGGLIRPAVRRRRTSIAVATAAVAGAMAALVFDLLTNLAIVVVFAMPLRAVLAGGAVIATMHVAMVAVAWGVLLPLLADRLARLRRGGPQAVGIALALMASTAAAAPPPGVETAAADSSGMAPADSSMVVAADSLRVAVVDTLSHAASDSLVQTAVDSLATAADDRRAELPEGVPDDWTLPLWEPFFVSLQEHLERRTTWLHVRDGGPGGAAMIIDEPSSDLTLPVWRDGVPLGVGHRWLDDAESVPLAGRVVRTARGWHDGRLGGVIDLTPQDVSPGTDFLDTRWYAGPHDSFLRDVQFLSADAPWRVGFDLFEMIDREGYDFRLPGETRYPEFDDLQSTEFWGHYRTRSGRGRLIRTLEGGDRVMLSLENARRTRHGVPVYDAQQQEYWRQQIMLRWQTGLPDNTTQATVWWTDQDMLLVTGFGADDRRLIESARSGAQMTWQPHGANWSLDSRYSRWSLADEGVSDGWAPGFADSSQMRGEEAMLAVTASTGLGGAVIETSLQADWAEHGGAALGGQATLRSADGPWRFNVGRARRAPRSDELATPWRVVVPSGEQSVVLPDANLDREDEWRVAASWSGRPLGLDLTLEGAARRLRHGIGWRVDPNDPDTGTLDNGVTMDSATLRARVAHAARMFGWLRLEAEGAWTTWTRDDDLQLALPPRWCYRVGALWEQRFFEEDGIAQLALYVHNRGAMDDPWFLAEPVALPAVSTTDAIVGFRLVGTNLSAEIHNLLGAGQQVSANAVNETRELRWRLHWVFRH
jgi:hypothetical protein